jgi:hypothetical protein
MASLLINQGVIKNGNSEIPLNLYEFHWSLWSAIRIIANGCNNPYCTPERIELSGNKLETRLKDEYNGLRG